MDRETLKHAETIRRMSGNGMTQRAIAKAVGVSLSTVNRVLNTSPADEPNSLAEMIARNNERRAILEQIYETYNRGEDTAALWAQANAI
jgi:transcriptional regulator with XRE-family HTH domain